MSTPFAILPDTGLDTIQGSAQAGFVWDIFADTASDTIQDSAQAGIARSILPGDLGTHRTAE